MKRTAWLALGGIVLVAAACGGTSSDLLGDGGASGDGAAGDGGGGDGGSRDGATVRRDGGGSCPDISGSYSISHTGDGCGDLSADATDCVQEDNQCGVQLKVNNGGRGVEGSVTLGSDGSFSGAAIKLGSNDRNGCTGTWDEGTSTLTIDCGGTGSSQSCVVTLTRTSTASCN